MILLCFCYLLEYLRRSLSRAFGLVFSTAIFLTFSVGSHGVDATTEESGKPQVEDVLQKFIQRESKYSFSGLASYYNKMNYYLVNKSSVDKLKISDSFVSHSDEWVVAVSRFNALVIQSNGVRFSLGEAGLDIETDNFSYPPAVQIVKKTDLISVSSELDQLRYAQLWSPLAILAKFIEGILLFVEETTSVGWGGTIIIFSCVLKFLLLPISILTVNFQRDVSQIQAVLDPKIREIKASFDGEEAHKRLMAVHSDHGVSPFYTLKPMLSSVVQIPILIAVFNVLGEMPQFNGVSFFWIENLALPDSVGVLPFNAAILGSSISVLPFLMTLITCYSTVRFRNVVVSSAEMNRQKRNLYLMAAAFFILFYPFPASMLLFWVLTNFLQVIQQRFIRI